MGEEIKFSDFNSKLAVIEILIYKKELLKPKFRLYDFLKAQIEKRYLNLLMKEGYEVVPKAKKYFEDLNIHLELLNQIVEIL